MKRLNKEMSFDQNFISGGPECLGKFRSNGNDYGNTVEAYTVNSRLYNFKGLFCPRTIGRTIESRDNGLISGWAYNRDFTVYWIDK